MEEQWLWYRNGVVEQEWGWGQNSRLVKCRVQLGVPLQPGPPGLSHLWNSHSFPGLHYLALPTWLNCVYYLPCPNLPIPNCLGWLGLFNPDLPAWDKITFNFTNKQCNSEETLTIIVNYENFSSLYDWLHKNCICTSIDYFPKRPVSIWNWQFKKPD